MKSIGDFAASLIEGDLELIKEGKALPPRRDKNTPKVSPDQRDISQVEVPDDFREAVILGESYTPTWPSQELDQYEEPEEQPTSPLTGEPLPSAGLLTESQGNEIISLLQEVKGMIEEMTTAGALGVNFAGPAATNPSRKKKKTKKDVLKESLRSKVRRFK